MEKKNEQRRRPGTMTSKHKPDDRSDNVERIQETIDNTVKNMRKAEDMMALMEDGSKSKKDLKEKNERRAMSLEAMRREIREEALDRERGYQ